MRIESLKKSKLPEKPGVYFFMKGKRILYIGKATSLRDRTKSYFSKDLIVTRGPLILDMVFKAERVKWEATDSVLEALILEANLIKKHQPYYNTREKDDKSFLCVVITGEKMPRVFTVRAHNLNELPSFLPDIKISKVYGPFTNGGQLREAMKIIRPIFPYIDIQSSKADNFQFYRQLGLTPDVGTREAMIAYRKNITNLKLFFEGKKKMIISNLKKEMMGYAKKREFERANEIKNRIFALTHINDISLLKNSPEAEILKSDSNSRIEAYDIAHMSGKNMVGVMTVVEEGVVAKSQYRKFNIKTQKGANDTGALVEVITRRLTHNEWAYPRLIVVDGGAAQLNAGQAAVERMRAVIEVVSVVKDDRHKPKAILGNEDTIRKYKRAILLANSEAHRFAIAFHKKRRARDFLK